jgi:hypothetical protein
MKPHIHAEVIKAWADGAAIEFRLDSSHAWNQTIEPTWYVGSEYRVKPVPVMAWYRVAEMVGHTACADTEPQENNLIQHCNFIRWLTDRISYELTL